MKDFKFSWANVKPAIPHFYFIGALLLMYLNNPHSNSKFILILAVPFVFQLLYQNKLTNFILGSLMLFAAGYISLGFLSEVNKIEDIDKSLYPTIGWGTFVLFNLIMSVWLLRTAVPD